jgi:hypothetical protein
MLTRSNSKQGEGKIASYNTEIGLRRFNRRREMTSLRKLGPYDSKDDFFEAFNLIKSMVEEMYEGRKKVKEEDKPEKVEPVKDEGGGGPSEPPSPYSLSASEHSSHNKKSTKKTFNSHNFPLSKLDVKFELPIYDGELNVEKLDNWIKQIEVYCKVQRIVEDTTKIQLATLCLGGTTLIWWESKTKVDLVQHGTIISSWDEFTVAIRKQFYPLAYVQKTIMEWKHLIQGKG